VAVVVDHSQALMPQTSLGRWLRGCCVCKGEVEGERGK
jgi:hypothetical protein